MASEPRQDVTQVLNAIRSGEPGASDRLLPLVYEELRQLARARMNGLPAGQTLQATALVHEAYLKLVSPVGGPGSWDSRAHFFGAAARAMRNILIDRARRKSSEKHGGGVRHQAVDDDIADRIESLHTDVLALEQALLQLEADDSRAHQIVMLRFFAGLTEEQTAEILQESPRTIRREWSYARAWLHRAIGGEPLRDTAESNA